MMLCLTSPAHDTTQRVSGENMRAGENSETTHARDAARAPPRPPHLPL